MHAKVIKSFHHANTGITWYAGSTFHGDDSAARQLAERGYLLLPGMGDASMAEAAAVPTAPSRAMLTVAELRALCSDRGIDVPPKARKADLIAALDAAGE